LHEKVWGDFPFSYPFKTKQSLSLYLLMDKTLKSNLPISRIVFNGIFGLFLAHETEDLDLLSPIPNNLIG
jgi:hypothetical protein